MNTLDQSVIEQTRALPAIELSYASASERTTARALLLIVALLPVGAILNDAVEISFDLKLMPSVLTGTLVPMLLCMLRLAGGLALTVTALCGRRSAKVGPTTAACAIYSATLVLVALAQTSYWNHWFGPQRNGISSIAVRVLCSGLSACIAPAAAFFVLRRQAQAGVF